MKALALPCILLALGDYGDSAYNSLPAHCCRSRLTRETMVKVLGAPLLILALAGCQSTPADEDLWANPASGMLIARDRCSGCHQTGRTAESPDARTPPLAGGETPLPDVPPNTDGDSPNPNAPPFPDIANRPGMTEQGIAAWLRDGHNYPVEMGFYLEPHQVDALAAYIVRLRAGDGAP